MSTKFKLIAGSIVAFVLVIGIMFMSAENVQQKIYDTKADLLGTPRIAQVYDEMGNNVAQYEDSDMRFELVGERSVRIWMGDKNKKVMVINMGVTIEDK